MLNWIWLAFLVISVLLAGFTGRLPQLTTGAFESAKGAVMDIALPLMGIWAIWLGMMRLAEQSGLVQKLAQALKPIMRRLFPDVPPEHPAMGAMVLNMAANMLGLGNAATPLGLRAMAHLERLNPRPGVASNAMCTFLTLNTASIQLIPTSAISILAINGSKNPTAIVPTAFLATVCAATVGVLSAKFLERLPGFRLAPAPETAPTETGLEAVVGDVVDAEKVQARPLSARAKIALALYFGAFAILLAVLVFPEAIHGMGFQTPPLPEALKDKTTGIRLLFSVAILAVPFLLSFFPLYAALRGVRVYEQFVEGAKEAFDTTKRVIPFLVAMLVSIRMLRDSTVLDRLQAFLQPLFDFLNFPGDLLPLVLMRPLSGSATNGIFVELVKQLGPDTLTSRIAATIFGSTETTFYVIAVYFGAVAIRQTRHAIAAGLIADFTAVVASVIFCKMLFPA
jgi:spore maturation protein SpmA